MPDDTCSEHKVQSYWHENDERNVRRGELIATMSWLHSWSDELKEMNANKRGRPFKFPSSLVRYVRLQRDIWHLSLRAAQGALRALGETLGFEAPDFTTLWKRLIKEEAEPVVPPRSQEHILAIDSTGIKVTERGEWMRDKWRLRRGFIKVHVAIDVTTMTVVAVIVSDERSHDRRFLIPLLQRAQAMLSGRIVRVLADGAYDSRENFDFLASHGIGAGIKLRKDAIVRDGGSAARNAAVVERDELGEDGWSGRYEYWLRWNVEIVFSAVKRTLGEALRSKRSDLMLREAQHKFVQYNRLVFAEDLVN
jgi:hypothetical protein